MDLSTLDAFQAGDSGSPAATAPPEPSTPGPERPGETPGADDRPEQTFEIPQIGKVPLSELTKGYLRHADYTRKTQQIAQRAKEFEQWSQERQSYETVLGQLKALLQDRAKLQAYLQTLPDPTPPPIDPQEILTAQQAMELMKRERQSLEQTFNDRLSKEARELRVEAYKSQYSEAIEQKLRAIAEAHPDLRRIPGMDLLLRQAVESQKPTSIQEALGLFDQAAQYYSQQFDSLVKTKLAPPTPLQKGIEPPGGSTVAPQVAPQEFSGIRDPKLKEQVLGDVMRLLSGR